MATDLQGDWQDRIQAALKKHKEWMDEFRVTLGRDYFEGKQNPGYPEEEWISIPKIYSHLQAQLPFLYSMDPYFYVKLKKSNQQGIADMEEEERAQIIAETELKGAVRGGYLNYLKVELELKLKARLGIQDAHFAYGVLKTRHASDTEKHPNAGKPILDEDKNELKDPETGEVQVYPDELPINKRYETLRIHPDDLIWDADAGPLSDSWGFIAQRIRMKKEDAQKDKRFDRAAAKSIAPKTTEKKKGILSWMAKKAKEHEEEFVDIWEIYDLDKSETLTMAEDAEDLLIKPHPVAPGVEGHPFNILRFTLRDNSPYPIPPISPAIDPQKEISFSRSAWMTHFKRFNRKYIVNVGQFEGDIDAELDKLEVGGDGTIIRARSTDAIKAIQDAPMDQQAMIQIQAFDRDITEAFGTPGSARGIADADSATEASILDTRLEIREGDRLSMVVDWITDWARKTDQLVQFHIEGDEAVKITGPQGEFWQIIKKDDYAEIQGEFEYSVNVGASRPRLPDIERAQLMAFFNQVVIPFPHILTQKATMKRFAELFHIEDDVMVEELRALGEKILSGALPMPGGQGGGPANNPGAAALGAALGPQGGNTNGGGAPTVQN